MSLKEQYLEEMRSVVEQLSILEDSLLFLEAYARKHGATDKEIEDAKVI